MKKIMFVLILAAVPFYTLLAEVLSVDPEATPKPIKITVEGLADAKPTSLTTQKDVFFKNSLFQPQPKNPAAEIKKMADSNAMESEIIDAIITKLADIEEEQRKQLMINTGIIAGLIALIVIGVFLIIKKQKKN
jgi:hypothetical protein